MASDAEGVSESGRIVVELIDSQPCLAGMLSEHLEDNCGELLPHLLLADVIRWIVSHRDTKTQVCVSILRYLDAAFIAVPTKCVASFR